MVVRSSALIHAIVLASAWACGAGCLARGSGSASDRASLASPQGDCAQARWSSAPEFANRRSDEDAGAYPFVQTDAGTRCYGLATGDALGRDDDEPDDGDDLDGGVAAHPMTPAVDPADGGRPPRLSDCELAMEARGVTPRAPDPLGAAKVRVTPERRHADLVVLVSVDGLRPDAINKNRTKRIWGLRKHGTWAARARTIRRAITLPSHTSMVTGVLPNPETGIGHGVLWNRPDETRGIVRAPTIFRIARRAGLFSAMVVAKKKFFSLIEPLGVHEYHRPGSVGLLVARNAARVIEQARPGVVFVHFADPDNFGHSHGWMRSRYMQAVSRVDGYLRHLTEAVDRRPNRARERILFVLTSDHGGQGRGHSGAREADRLIPWLAWGDGVAQRTIPPTREISTLDTAATVLWALGIDVPRWMQGRAVEEVYQAPARPPPRRRPGRRGRR